jgi:hypothetical protein
MHERLVVAVLVDRGELQVAVEEEAHVVAAHRLGQDDLLVLGAHVQRDRVVVERLPRARLERPGDHRHRGDGDDHRAERARQRPRAWPRQRRAQRPQHDAARDRVDRAERERGLDLTDAREDQQRERQADRERPDVVGGQQRADRPPGLLAPQRREHRRQQRQLGADERAEDHRHEPHGGLVEVEPGVRGEEDERRQPAEQRDEHLDDGERRHRVPRRDPRGEQRAEAHRRDERAEDDRRLRRRGADQHRAQRDDHELVREPADRADERRREHDSPGRPRPRRVCGEMPGGGHHDNAGPAPRCPAAALMRSRRR